MSRGVARRGDTGDQTLRLLPGPGENDSFHLKNGTDCVGANAKKKKKTSVFMNYNFVKEVGWGVGGSRVIIY